MKVILRYTKGKSIFNPNLLRKLFLKKIRIVTSNRTFTGTLVCFDDTVLTLRIKPAGKTFYITIPQNKVDGLIGTAGPQPPVKYKPGQNAYGLCIA